MDTGRTEMIKRQGYPAEEHVVLTDDGYYLTLHRIPGKPGSTPVFIQHGILCTSFDWVISGKNKAIALMLWDHGYDVWIGNSRGNTYSTCHKKYTTSDFEYWNFSWHEMGIYDLPAVINYITKLTQKNLIYVGHSMGTTMFYVMAVERPDIAKKVNAMFSLAPVAYIHRLRSPVKWPAPFAREIEALSKMMKVGELFSQTRFIKYALHFICNPLTFQRRLCATFIFALFGFDNPQFNYDKLPLILSHTPAGIALKVAVHYFQEMNTGRFAHYDYGPKINMKLYNSTVVPEYDVSKIQTPIGIFWSENDWITNRDDIMEFYSKIPNKIMMYTITNKKFNHVDFMWAKDADKFVYTELIEAMNPYRSHSMKMKINQLFRYTFVISMCYLQFGKCDFPTLDEIISKVASIPNNAGDLLLFGLPRRIKSIDPEVQMTTPEMIRKEGYPSEAHVVLTDDGYLLTMHRIPGPLGSPVVFLQHGLLASSSDWVIAGKNKSLAYILSDHGYDVWMGNARGNTYSRSHVNYSTTDLKFWNFSWHEMAIYDLPTQISFITELKKSNLTYIGHSMGTTMFYAMAIERPDIASKIKAMFALAPVAFVDHIKSPVRLLTPFLNELEFIARYIGEGEFLPQNGLLKFLARYGCDVYVTEEKICANALFAICGFDASQFDYKLLPRILSHTPAGASTKTIIHYGQEVKSGKFQYYDYGRKGNILMYNSSTPPEYDLSKVQVPVGLFWAENDWLAGSKDVTKLYDALPNKIFMYKVNYPKFNHLDFLMAVDVTKLVYKKLLEAMQEYR
ncbi:hypothetical protein QAD02_011518 [Eretmocerus hayati]|uniref:Uncharacterized protein n=1 Tax=Eretmocerus hayati TaxID=131215 RepID=A0ACC2NZW1_9HYME|nr:hypothetical protein QAD02_011518 [Eretmocerus hayati]